MRVSWRSPTPIREEAPPAITAQVAQATPNQGQLPQMTGGRQARNFSKNRQKPPWLWGPRAGKGKSRGKDKGKNQNKGKDKSKHRK